MAKQNINIGLTANDKQGDSLREAFRKVNTNFTELYTAVGGGNTIAVYDELVELTNSVSVLRFVGAGVSVINQGTDVRVTVDGDRLTNGLNEVSLNATGALVYPNVALQRDTATVACPGNASTVVYTASGQYQHTIRLLIQVEGTVGAAADMDTQACEMIIAKSFRANDIAATVYGIVHTSVAPLATFTALWNGLTSRVEVLCTAPSANTVNVKIFATEITTSD